MNIIARKPRDLQPSVNGTQVEYIVVDRGEPTWSSLPSHAYMRFVSATATKESLEYGEWFWGHYFLTLEEAMNHFNGR